MKLQGPQLKGTIIEKARGGVFRARIAGTDYAVCCRVAHKMHERDILLTKGDRVLIVMSPDLSRGRIHFSGFVNDDRRTQHDIAGQTFSKRSEGAFAE